MSKFDSDIFWNSVEGLLSFLDLTNEIARVEVHVDATAGAAANISSPAFHAQAKSRTGRMKGP
jgi:hypothetical protein